MRLLPNTGLFTNPTSFSTTLLAIVPAYFGAQDGRSQHHPGAPKTGPAHPSGHAMGDTAMKALAALSGKAFDVAFLSQMIAHHRGALTMSKSALPTLKSPAVRRRAEQIIRDQNTEIARMTTILRKEFQTGPSPEQARMMEADSKSMMAMKPAGDRMFLTMMTPHHQGAIQMSRLALRKSGSASVRNLAGMILRVQTSEIQAFQRLLADGSLHS